MTTRSEWYTPAHIIEAARLVMGGIDLDPASCVEAQAIIKADNYYTAEQDGLEQPWEGRIWCNPPYGRGIMDRFVSKAVEASKGEDTEAILLLTNNCTDTQWWQHAAQSADLICHLSGRLSFWGPHEKGNGAAQGQTVMLMAGPKSQRWNDYADLLRRFCAVFGKLGWIGEMA